jgi:riboflavin synthase alpha subunit
MWYNETLAVNIVSDSDFNVSNFNIEHHLLVDQAIYRTDLANLKPIDAMVFEEALAFLDEFETLLVDASVRFVTKLADKETGRETKTFFSRLVEAAIENKTPQDAETKAVKTDAKK